MENARADELHGYGVSRSVMRKRKPREDRPGECRLAWAPEKPENVIKYCSGTRLEIHGCKRNAKLMNGFGGWSKKSEGLSEGRVYPLVVR